jgi:hypothetical protein
METMSTFKTEGNKPSDGDDGKNIRSFLYGGVILTLPYLFVWYLMKGGGFVLTYIWYLQVACYAGGAVGILTIIALVAKKRFPALFENPPKSPEWLGVVGAGMSVVVSIVGGFLDGWQTGLLLFWPAIFFAVCITRGFHWVAYQVRRWWLNCRT